MSAPARPTVFISYSHLDERWKNLTVKHLGVLRDQGLIKLWEDRQIAAGADWHTNIQDALGAASIAVILITANSLTSEYILGDEVPPLIERCAKEGVRIFPVIAEPCAWESVEWLRRMNLRPAGARPLSEGNKNQINADLAALTSEIYLLVKAADPAPAGRIFVPLNPDDVATGRLPVTGRELFGRDLELDMLDGAWADPVTNVISLVAWGGVGKSALVNHWQRRMARDNYRGAQKVYAWSFYRQGTSDQGVSADQFIDAALRWFGDANPTEGSPWEKGERLARLVKAQRTLLFLDGLEPLQYPPHSGLQVGALKEHSMQALLRELAALNPGLCVITTRLHVHDLADFEGETARLINLEHLSPEAGAEVLKAQGATGEQSELERASADFGGHALALTLLGSYLKNVYDGDINQRDKVDILKEDEERGGHAQRVMASYEKWFGDASPELAVLRMIALFDRPADGPSLTALRAAPAIPSLTDPLQTLTDEDWRRTLARLRTARLIADKDTSQPDSLDAHPLVREHFKKQLKRHYPDAWREGNNRLYEHLKNTAKEFPETIEEMSPLFAAVVHGCEANRYQETLDEVFFKRMDRGKAFVARNLGAIGATMSALSAFFDPPWQKPVTRISDGDRAYLLNVAGFCLGASGRLVEAVQPAQASLEASILRENWGNAAVCASNLSELYLNIGDLSQALTYAQKGVELADQSGDGVHRMGKRTTLADAIYQAGRLSESEAVFHEAEEIQKARQPTLHLLYGLAGFRYCALLLHQGDYRQVQTRAAQTIEWAKQYHMSLLAVALDYLSLGRACLLQARLESTGNFLQATDYLNQAVDGLRMTGYLDSLPRGLLARAELNRVKGNFDRAQVDLDEALSLATRGGMGLYRADCHLGYTWLYLEQEEKDEDKALEHLRTAKEMIGRMGYHLRDEEVRELEGLLEEGAEG